MTSTFSLNSHDGELSIQFGEHSWLIQFVNNITCHIRRAGSSIQHIKLHYSPMYNNIMWACVTLGGFELYNKDTHVTLD